MPVQDPLKRTHKDPDDIVANILDIIDDYLIFLDSYEGNIEKKEDMFAELRAYIGNLNGG